MSNTKHTPGPWTAIITTDGTHEVTTSDGVYPQTVARMYSTGKLMQSQAPANAAHIVKCVNAHDDLVTALQSLLGAASTAGATGVMGTDGIRLLHLAMSDARAALAKAGAL